MEVLCIKITPIVDTYVFHDLLSYTPKVFLVILSFVHVIVVFSSSINFRANVNHMQQQVASYNFSDDNNSAMIITVYNSLTVLTD